MPFPVSILDWRASGFPLNRLTAACLWAPSGGLPRCSCCWKYYAFWCQLWRHWGYSQFLNDNVLSNLIWCTTLPRCSHECLVSAFSLSLFFIYCFLFLLSRVFPCVFYGYVLVLFLSLGLLLLEYWNFQLLLTAS